VTIHPPVRLVGEPKKTRKRKEEKRHPRGGKLAILGLAGRRSGTCSAGRQMLEVTRCNTTLGFKNPKTLSKKS